MPQHTAARNGETSPLLGAQQQHYPESEVQKPAPPRWLWQAKNPHTVVLILAIISFFVCSASAMVNMALTRLIEDNLCHRFYDRNEGTSRSYLPIDEKDCKFDKLQSDLAYLLGATSTIEAIFCLVFAFPYGILADIIGRKPVFLLSVSGAAINIIFTLAVLWFRYSASYTMLGPVFSIIGGGNAVFMAVLYSMVSDVLTCHGSSAFFVLTLSALIGNSAAPAVAANLMHTFSPWVPALLALVIVPLAIGLVVFVPETLPLAKQKQHPEILRTHEAEDPDADTDHHHHHSEAPTHSFKSKLTQTFNHLKDFLSAISFRNPSLILVLATFLVRMPETYATGMLFVQYVSVRAGWTIAEAGYLLAVRGAINMVVLLIALPVLSKLVIFQAGSVAAKDLSLARFSAGFAVLGLLLIGAPSVGVMIVGLGLSTFAAGLAPLCRSLASSYVAPEDTSKLYTLIGMLDAGGLIYAGPSMAWLFTKGMQLKGLWMGLPYFVLAGAYVLCVVVLLLVRVPPLPIVDDDELEEDRL
ncbi:major facilitator superfamily domain-containing protein [Podospora didyma]|uniref:Major facilitator superfamily domain-containing protein n=1 Tax=Podospora didyma TaxID=330526 RepID=A0AAE0N2X9_9PEZI|nr:major facilitator superfamily domain-containing protein [Podospora didyma]